MCFSTDAGDIMDSGPYLSEVRSVWSRGLLRQRLQRCKSHRIATQAELLTPCAAGCSCGTRGADNGYTGGG